MPRFTRIILFVIFGRITSYIPGWAATKRPAYTQGTCTTYLFNFENIFQLRAIDLQICGFAQIWGSDSYERKAQPLKKEEKKEEKNAPSLNNVRSVREKVTTKETAILIFCLQNLTFVNYLFIFCNAKLNAWCILNHSSVKNQCFVIAVSVRTLIPRVMTLA